MKVNRLFLPLLMAVVRQTSLLAVMMAMCPAMLWAGGTKPTSGSGTTCDPYFNTGTAMYQAEVEINQYTITVTSADEVMGTVSGGGTYDENSQITITATPKEHYHFVKWNDDNPDASRQITVTDEATYTAYFAIDQHAITVTSDNDNMGTVTGGGTYDYNTSVTITATPKTGYYFVKWDDGDTNASRQITVTGAATYTAYFAANTYTVTVDNNYSDKLGNAYISGTANGDGTYDYGTTIKLCGPTVEGANTGYYHFIKWEDEDGNRLYDRVQEVTVTGNKNYTATYEYVYNITGNTLDSVASWAEGALVIPDGVDTISADAFNGCAVTAVTIPATINTIAEHAFNGCNSLTDITFAPGSRCKSIGENAVYNTSARPSLHLTSLPKIGSQSCLTVASLALTDSSYVTTVDAEFSYVTFPGKGTRTYTRTMSETSQWGTAVLPFTVETNSEVQLYSIVSISCPTDGNEEQGTEPAGTITLSAVSDTIPANRPFVFRKKNPNATSVTFTDSKNPHAIIPHNEKNSFTISEVGVTLVGTYVENNLDQCQGEGEECKSTNYFIAQNAFWRADNGVTIPPFRAWFDFSNYDFNSQTGAPAFFTIIEGEEDSSGISELKAESGRQKEGKFMENGCVVIYRNGQKYSITGFR